MPAYVVGVISDTHSVLRPEAVAALQNVALIIHAGDIGRPEVLTALGGIAPVYPVRGNNDTGPWANAIPETRIVTVGGMTLYVLHDLHDLTIEPAIQGIQVVVAGHSHRPSLETRDGVLFLNPGSAGPRRFRLPVCLARLSVQDHGFNPEIVTLMP